MSTLSRMVIKLGTSTLTAGTPRLSRKAMTEVTRQVAKLYRKGIKIVLVTSGACTAGREVLSGAELGKSLPTKQMFASLGQVRLMQVWTELFAEEGINVGQILLTRNDFSLRAPYLNVRDTIHALLDHGVVPIVNENDPVATKHSFVGDNDHLGAHIANMIAAHLYVILTDQKGLYDKNPNHHADAQLIPLVKSIDDAVVEAAKESSTTLGTGGMATKISAAELASNSGTPTEITSMETEDVLLKLASGDMIGTRFTAATSPRESRKRWLLSEKPSGQVHIDRGASQKLTLSGASLLPVGVTKVSGSFDRGAPIEIVYEKESLGVGLSNYASAEIEKIKKSQSDQIESLLGYSFGPEVIHRDNMVITGGNE